jgi:hypothetical protein
VETFGGVFVMPVRSFVQRFGLVLLCINVPVFLVCMIHENGVGAASSFMAIIAAGIMWQENGDDK